MDTGSAVYAVRPWWHYAPSISRITSRRRPSPSPRRHRLHLPLTHRSAVASVSAPRRGRMWAATSPWRSKMLWAPRACIRALWLTTSATARECQGHNVPPEEGPARHDARSSRIDRQLALRAAACFDEKTGWACIPVPRACAARLTPTYRPRSCSGQHTLWITHYADDGEKDSDDGE